MQKSSPKARADALLAEIRVRSGELAVLEAEVQAKIAAITAEISNMKVQEEIDAMQGMGLNVSQFLVAPKLLAMVIVMPCLTAMGIVAGVLGGAVWGLLVLGHRPSVWFLQTLSWASVNGTHLGGFMERNRMPASMPALVIVPDLKPRRVCLPPITASGAVHAATIHIRSSSIGPDRATRWSTASASSRSARV